jgi:hypothetical protein
MKKIILLLAIVSLSACKKKSTTTTPEQTLVAATPGFTWTENGGAMITADSSYWTTSNNSTGIRAYKGGFANFFEINWSGLNNTAIGAKSMSATNFDFTFLKGQDSYNISSTQPINITAFNNNLLSGNFDLTVTGGSITNLKGAFTDIVKK